jgi:hypothetical protein
MGKPVCKRITSVLILVHKLTKEKLPLAPGFCFQFPLETAANIYMYVCLYVCRYVRMYVCVYTYVYRYIYIYIYIYGKRKFVSLVGKQKKVIEDCCFRKRAHLWL